MVSSGKRRPQSGAAGDLAALAELDEATLLSGLPERFLRQQVYTDVGDILIAMKPFQPLPLHRREVSASGPPPAGLHCPQPLHHLSITGSPQVSEQYRFHEMGTLPPRIFTIADKTVVV
ncbi:unconventional myosin-Ig-like isoform X1 [Ciconia boyciana]|uniref:unconventional myosin-Ig-like isoform X1 n=1 Tax=Ciconia boyciana TaxID=52775 RepID=UPI003BA09B30